MPSVNTLRFEDCEGWQVETSALGDVISSGKAGCIRTSSKSPELPEVIVFDRRATIPLAVFLNHVRLMGWDVKPPA